jgi:putative glutamine amidotransferase
VTAPLVLIVGRYVDDAKGVRGPAFGSGRQYSLAVERAGGVPLTVAPIPALRDRLDGLIDRVDAVVLHGGGDVDPRRYGEEPTAEQLYGIVPDHDEVEFTVAAAALRRDIPMLAICRGLQVLNVALGGSLHQHIGEAHWFADSDVEVAPDSRLAAALGTAAPTQCHCVHHQAVDRVADDLVVVGRTADGIIHAAEHRSARWVVAPQWHPEDTAANDAVQQRLFDELIRQS